MFKSTLNDLRSTFDKINHDKVMLKSLFSFSDTEADTYKQIYAEAKELYTALDKRFHILEGDC